MPAVSKKQFRFMQAAAHGEAKDSDIPPEKAKEFLKKVRYGKLPEKKSTK